MTSSSELRKLYLEFFRSKGHTVIPSSSLITEDKLGPVLFTMAGMYPLIPYLTGESLHPSGTRLCNSQKCVRTADIDLVGDATHLTFFEMLGNWSLGDYFKQDAIRWSYEFLTSPEWLNIPVDKLAVSIHGESQWAAVWDFESLSLWNELGIPQNRCATLPDNWWSTGVDGPCGPDTEIFYWNSDEPEPTEFQVSHTDPRWVEIWNNVFIEFETVNGIQRPLRQRNVDTGMGLERTLMVLNNERSVYDTDLFLPMFDVFGGDPDSHADRIIVDHIKTAIFLCSEGLKPSNKMWGYVLRRLLRKVYHLIVYDVERIIKDLTEAVLNIYSNSYPELNRSIIDITNDEYPKFLRLLDNSQKQIQKLRHRNGRIHSNDAFMLYQIYGIPLDIILAELLPEDDHKSLVEESFLFQFQEHQKRSKVA